MTGINDLGQITGTYVDSNGNQDAFIGTPMAAVPEPSSLIMASVGGLITLGAWARRRRRAEIAA